MVFWAAGDCDDGDNLTYPGAPEVLDCVDNDCDGTVDEGFVACEPLAGDCSGTLDCSGAFDVTGVCEPGCVEVPGRCSVSDELCDPDNPCHGNGNVCVGYSCSGSTNCGMFGVLDCHEYRSDGCSPSVCGSSSYKNTTDALMGGNACDDLLGCAWNCGAGVAYQEICSNGVDDDGVNGIDCLDSACRKASWTPDEVDRYNCLGTPQSGDVPGLAYQCSNGVDEKGDVVPDIGLCCPAGKYPSKENSGGAYYECIDSTICHNVQYQSCDYDYSSDFTSWIGSTGDYLTSTKWCVDPTNQKACCLAVSFGDENYYSDTNNVVVY